MQVSTMLGPALGAVVGGVVAALVTVWVVTPSKTPAKRVAKIEAEAPEEEPASDLEDRVDRLEQAVGSLARRSALPSVAASARPAQPGDAPPAVGDPVFEAAVRDVIGRMEEERIADREQERSERRKQRADEWSKGLAGTLRLTEQQRAAAGAIAQRFYDQLREIGNSDAGRLDREARRTRAAELRNQADAELARVLDGRQMQSYRELPEEQRLGGRRGRNRDRRPQSE